MIETIATALLIHLGKTAIDKVWSARNKSDMPVAMPTGEVSLVAGSTGRTTVPPAITVPRSQRAASLTGNLYLDSSLSSWAQENGICLVLLVEEATQQPLLFEANQQAGYQISLPEGVYSSYVFLLDPRANDLLAAQIYAIGMRSTVDLPSGDEFTVDPPYTLLDIVTEDPFALTAGRSYRMDFVLIDRDTDPEWPISLGQLMGYGNNLTAQWRLTEVYEHGETLAAVYLIQEGDALYGIVMRHDWTDDGTEWIVKETVAGSVSGDNVSLQGLNGEVIVGDADTDYFLDNWEGYLEHRDVIRGISEDAGGTRGEFVMERMAS